MEAFQPGEVVALRESSGDTRGRVVDVSADGRTVDVHCSLRPGHHDQVTTENEAMLRLVHESEEGMVTP
jgi:hypothetical protein